MLVITRKPKELFYIGDNITVTVLGVQGNHVRIGIDAPKTIPIHREEVAKRIENERKMAEWNDSNHL